MGQQTREHDGLDCVIALADAAAAQTALAPLGFTLVEDELPTRFVMCDAADRRFDVHPVMFDGDGGGVQRLQDGSTWRYAPEGIIATGHIAGQTVPCISAEVQAATHVGYEPDAKDVHDMSLLASLFEVDLPRPYRVTP